MNYRCSTRSAYVRGRTWSTFGLHDIWGFIINGACPPFLCNRVVHPVRGRWSRMEVCIDAGGYTGRAVCMADCGGHER